jgi:hypothetical protein
VSHGSRDAMAQLAASLVAEGSWIEVGTETALVHALRQAGLPRHRSAGTGHLLRGALYDPQDSGAHLLRMLAGGPGLGSVAGVVQRGSGASTVPTVGLPDGRPT